MEETTRTITCRNCPTQFKVDLSKAPKDVFTVACPKCGQKYQMKKPGVQTAQTQPAPTPSRPSPAVASQASALSSPSAAPHGIDLSHFNPRTGWEYNLYRYTRMLPYAKHVTLSIYGSKLVSSIVSIAKHQAAIGSISPSAYAAMKANMSATCSTIYSVAIAPELAELGIPRFMQKPFAASFTRSLSEQLSSSLVSMPIAVGTRPVQSYISPDTSLPILPERPEHATKNQSAQTHLRLQIPEGSPPTQPKQTSQPPAMGSPEQLIQRPVPTGMWVIGVLMLLACFQPWIQLHGSSVLGFQDATHVWQGKVAIALIAVALLAKQFSKHGLSGVLALIVPALAIQLWTVTANAILHIEPHAGGITLVILSIPFTVLAFRPRRAEQELLPSTPAAPAPRAPVPALPQPTAAAPRIPKPPPNKPTRSPKPFLIAGAALALLGLGAWWFFDLRHRHTLTEAERAQAEGWFHDLSGKTWLLLERSVDVTPGQSMTIARPIVTADNYGTTTITVSIQVSGHSDEYDLGRFVAQVERPYTDLSEPRVLELSDDIPNDAGEGIYMTWRIINADSIIVEISRDEDGSTNYYGIPAERYAMLQAAAESARKTALTQAIDSIGQGIGLVRRGSFRAYACGDECGATFLEVRNGQPVPVTYVCNTNRFGDVQLSTGDMIGAGDFTNQAIVGREFLVVSKQMQLPDAGPVWVIMGLLPFSNDQLTPELQQRLALSANFDAGTPVPSATDPDGAPPAFLTSDVYDLNAVQQQPGFPGGMEKMYEFMGKMQKYPDMEYEAGIQGKVYIQFTVAKDGSIQEAKVLRSVSAGLDREALRMVKSMPRWTPGYMEGKAVNCRFNLPIVFALK